MNAFKSSDRILIIGGTGFIGSHLDRKCLEYTPYVTCLGFSGNTDKTALVDNIEFIKCDVTEKKQLLSALNNKTFDYVFNLGGYIDHTPYFQGGRGLIESHFLGLMNLIDCLNIKKLKGFVQIGSSDEYGNGSAPQKESIRETPISPYSFAKAAASQLIQTLFRTEGFPGVVLRFFLVYGPGQDNKRFLPQIIRGCLKDEEFKTSEGKQLRDFCYVGDAIDAIVRAALLTEAKGHVINIGSGVPVTIKEMVKKVISLTGGGKPIWGAFPYREGENMELYADTTLAKKLLKWEPFTDLDEGLRITIDYFKKSMAGEKK